VLDLDEGSTSHTAPGAPSTLLEDVLRLLQQPQYSIIGSGAAAQQSWSGRISPKAAGGGAAGASAARPAPDDDNNTTPPDLALPAASVILETTDVAQASPACLSRCCVVHIAPPRRMWLRYLESWLATCTVVTQLPMWGQVAVRRVLVTSGNVGEVLHTLRKHVPDLYGAPGADVTLQLTTPRAMVRLGLCFMFSSVCFAPTCTPSSMHLHSWSLDWVYDVL